MFKDIVAVIKQIVAQLFQAVSKKNKAFISTPPQKIP